MHGLACNPLRHENVSLEDKTLRLRCIVSLTSCSVVPAILSIVIVFSLFAISQSLLMLKMTNLLSKLANDSSLRIYLSLKIFEHSLSLSLIAFNQSASFVFNVLIDRGNGLAQLAHCLEDLMMERLMSRGHLDKLCNSGLTLPCKFAYRVWVSLVCSLSTRWGQNRSFKLLLNIDHALENTIWAAVEAFISDLLIRNVLFQFLISWWLVFAFFCTLHLERRWELLQFGIERAFTTRTLLFFWFSLQNRRKIESLPILTGYDSGEFTFFWAHLFYGFLFIRNKIDCPQDCSEKTLISSFKIS